MILVMTTGCTSKNNEYSEEIPIPYDWHASKDSDIFNDDIPLTPWWQSLNDPILSSLIEQSNQQNIDVTIAIHKIMATRESRKGAEADQYPHIDATANIGGTQFNNHILKAVGNSCNKKKDTLSFYELGFDAEWEIDLFRAKRHEVQATLAEEAVSCENLNDLLVTLHAEIGRNYIELRSYQCELRIIEETIDSLTTTQKLTQDLFTTGFIGVLDPLRIEQQLSLLKADRPLIQLSIDKSIYRLATLVGMPITELYNDLINPKELPSVPSNTPIGFPSQLLRNRPDIRRAEKTLAATTHRVDGAIAALFPRLSLRGFIGDITMQMNKPGLCWFAGAGLLAPIFNSREIHQNIDLSKINQQQAFNEYQKVVVLSIEETENAIASFHYELNRYDQLKIGLEIVEKRYQEITQLYNTGFKSYLELLEDQRAYLEMLELILKSKANATLHYISIYKALGAF
jgi:outer membrane protein, multidrug efflux system